MRARKRSEISESLRRRLVSGLHLGLLRPGDRLPSVRELGREFGAHQRVILAAYRELERDGLVEFRPRSGIYVAATAAPVLGMLPAMARRMVEFLVEGLSFGVSATEMPERMRRCIETLRLRAVCVECNDDQIDSLCRQLHTDYGLTSTAVELHELDTAEAEAEIRRADLIVTTSFHANDVRRVAERAGKPWIATSLRADMVAEIARHLVQGPVYFVGTDPRFAQKTRDIFGAMPSGHNVRPVIVGQDDVLLIPESAPAYVMARAREKLGGLPLLARVPPMERTFSADSAREILTFIVRANMAALASQLSPGTLNATRT